jgi:ABC-type proline/glycine betaine transport system ATPase subunit
MGSVLPSIGGTPHGRNENYGEVCMAGEITLKGQNLYTLSEGEVQNLRGSLVAMVFQG